jgi:aminoglycoside phosphotransferase (APT) family kinase protein
LRERFAAWLSETVGAPATVGPMTAPSSGMSSDTFLTSADWGVGERGLVLRLSPEGRGLFPRYDLDAQVTVMRGLATSNVPVPEVLWFEADPEPLGRSFVVMARVDGRIPPDGHVFDGWVKELSATEQRHVLDAALDVLYRIHRVVVDNAVLDALDRPEHSDSPIDQEVGYWRAYLEWASDGDALPVLEDALEQLAARRPSSDERGLVWGDARLGNLVYDDALVVRAVLDWEMAVLGPPELDLGWYLFLERTALQYAPQLPGFPDRDGTVRAYEARLGREARDLDWYEAWGGLRAACIQVRLADTLEARERNPVTKALRGLLS